ncbi:class I SAM-dependent methyltransferase [Streptomyces halobius]|uniref:Class I SAM-dependent methyltransferase n=1 Tax=Streptomyces halobius TaxID=2879846 RepID=A0ABY4M7E3_9ACTN|nr:class I SAM-dependent methyltransferase [Streptomyces halobius]UQA93699.1 class I SAM-dependent methyltransferase [Streptomyces halobius]
MLHPTMTDILVQELARMRSVCQRNGLDLLETGCIRNTAPGHRLADGWSTLTFAQHVRDYGGSVASVDLNTSQAKLVLNSAGLIDKVELINDDSVKTLQGLRGEGRAFDFVLLDSGNDPALIFREYQVATEMVRRPSLIAIDDVKYYPDAHGTKGELVVPHLEAQGIPFRVNRRWGGLGWIDVVLIELSPTR